MSAQPTLDDGRVTLRPLREDDVQGVWEQCNDPLSIRWTQVPVPYSHADARDFCLEIAPSAWDDGSQAIFAVESDGGYCGNLALRDEGWGRAEIAYGAHPAARGRGVMTAAVRLLLDWGFAARGVQTMIWRAEVGNWASRRLAWRLGFSHDGVLRHSLESRDVGLVDGWLGTLRPGDPRAPALPWYRPPELAGPTSSGRRVRVRPMVEADLPRVVAACSDEETQRWLAGLPSPYTIEDAHEWWQATLESAAVGRSVHWAVGDAADPDERMAASVALMRIAPGVDAEVGYWTHPDARGRGLTSAAVRLVADWAFGTLGLGRLECHHAVGNDASRRLIEVVGFTRYGVERLGTQLRDGRADLARYDLLAEEWTGSTGSSADSARTG